MALGERVTLEYTMSIRLTSILLRSYLLYILTRQPAFKAYPRNNPRCRIQKYPCPGIPMRGYRIIASHRLVHLDISVLHGCFSMWDISRPVDDRPLVLVPCGVRVR
jgi:hypothetical protein